nr:hypothetical protein [Tanacetum cinerariifolium]
MEFEVGDMVMLKVLPWKGVVRFVMPLEGIHVDDRLQFVQEPVEIMEQEIKRLKQSRILLVKVRWNSRRGPKFTWEREYSFRKKYPHLFTSRASSSMARVHHTFHVSNVKKCYSDESLVMSLEGVHINDTLQFVEEPVEIMEREIKRLKRNWIPLVKVLWNSRRGPEFTWGREDSFKKKYLHIFTNRTSSSTTRS